MDWTKGFSASYHISVVDPFTWRDTDRIEITGGTIKREISGLLESADINVVRYDGAERWVRIWLDSKQNETAEHTALFTGLATSPDRDINGTLETNNLQCFSVLKPADDVLLKRGWYAPLGSDSALVKKLLKVTPAPIVVEDNSPTLKDHIIAEDGETNLTMAYKILNALNWRLKIEGDGTIHIMPKAQEVSERLDTIANDIIEPQIKVMFDWYSCPNVFIAYDDELMAVARDDSEESPLSTVNRGREIMAEESNVDLASNETLSDYALRKLKELQQVESTIDYNRRYIPDLTPSDRVYLQLPMIGVEGAYEITSQTITIGHGARTGESVSWTKD